VQTQGPLTIESVAAQLHDAGDTFIPPAPTNRAFAGDGSVRLTWDAVQAGDLAGYTVCAARAPVTHFSRSRRR
jgi:hypothetical protein